MAQHYIGIVATHPGCWVGYAVLSSAADHHPPTPPHTHTGESLNKLPGEGVLTIQTQEIDPMCLNVGMASSALANIKTSLDQRLLLTGIVGSWRGSETARVDLILQDYLIFIISPRAYK